MKEKNNLNEVKNHKKGKKDSKYSQIIWDMNHGLIIKKESKNSDTSKITAEGTLGMKMIK